MDINQIGKRPAFDALLKAVSRREIDMVAAFAVDRLGRSLPDLIAFLSDLQAKGTSFADVREGFHQRGMKIGTVEVD